jgi:hypothetical protein
MTVENEVVEEQAADLGNPEQIPQEEAAGEINEEIPDQEASGDGEPTPEVPSYEPNYNYKVYGEEKEIPEEFRSLIKDKESEELVRSYLSKADGFEPLKSKYESARTERDDFKGKYGDLSGEIQKLNHFIKNDRLSAYEMLGISQDMLLDDASKLITVREMEPEQRKEWEEQRNINAQNFDFQEKVSFLEQQNQELMRKQQEFELDQVLSRGDVSTVQQHYDQKFGPGAFKRKVIFNAANVYNQTGDDLTPERAVSQIVDEYTQLGLSFNQQAQQSSAGSHGSTNTQPKSQPKSLPNLGNGRGVSPTAPVLKSIDDLKRIRQERYGS